MLGKKHTAESKAKMSMAHIGKRLSSEHRDKVVKTLNHLKGSGNPAWKGGFTEREGYILVRMPNHPKAYSNGYIKRAVVVAEEKIGRHLEKDEITHHVNGIKNDDRPENIEILSARKHNSITAKERWRSGNLNYDVLRRHKGEK